MRRFRFISISLFLFAFIINVVSSKFPQLVEEYYSNGINIYIVKILSKISSVLPFSLFEILIYIGVISIIGFIIYSIIYISKNPKSILSYLKNSILNIISIVGLIYFIFIALWGLNYNRMDLANSLIVDYNKTNNQNIKEVEYDEDDLKDLYKFLVGKCNEIRHDVLENENGVMKNNTDYREVLSRAKDGYENVHILNLNKKGSYATAKPILNSNLLCYTSITGIYSPFTGEANVNVAAPDYYIPFTTLHEMAHQRGYASEDEANFLAYIAGINHEDYDFQYSAYILALNYTASAFSRADYNNYVQLTRTLSDEVRNDIKKSSEFWSQYEGKVSEVSDNVNNTYLKSNGVKEGTQSYGKVVELLLTYYQLYEK
ncbi:MAG: DUF3810 domain-containing protein [Terrisporobacter sp.]